MICSNKFSFDHQIINLYSLMDFSKPQFAKPPTNNGHRSWSKTSLWRNLKIGGERVRHDINWAESRLRRWEISWEYNMIARPHRNWCDLSSRNEKNLTSANCSKRNRLFVKFSVASTKRQERYRRRKWNVCKLSGKKRNGEKKNAWHCRYYRKRKKTRGKVILSR